MIAAVGAAHRLPCASRLGVVRRNSLRSLRSLRSDKAPQVRHTKRASRADPEAAMLGAADIRAPGRRAARLPKRADAASPGFGERARSLLTLPPPATAATLAAKACAGCGRRACAQPRSAAAPAARAARAVHHSRGDCPSAARASERSEFRRASRCCEHHRAPPRSGGKRRHADRSRRTALLAQSVPRRPQPAHDFARAIGGATPAVGYSGFFSQCAISPTTPRLNAITQTTKIAPCTTVTHAPICAR